MACKLVVSGFAACKYFQRTVPAVELAAKKGLMQPPIINMFPTKEAYLHWLEVDDKRPRALEPEKAHRTSPFVYDCNTGKYIGGHDSTMEYLKTL